MKLNLGCGPRYINGWQNIDWSSQYKVDHNLDLGNERLPFADDTVSEAVSSHIIEHMTRWEGIHHIKEVYRVLRKGGEFILSFPDLAKIVKCFHGSLPGPNVKNNHEWLIRAIFETQIDETIVHKYGYTNETARALLISTGFKSIDEIKTHVDIDGHRICHYSFATTIYKVTK